MPTPDRGNETDPGRRAAAFAERDTIELTPIDELRKVSRRLATEVELNVERRAKMLAETAIKTPGTHVAKPLVLQVGATPPAKKS